MILNRKVLQSRFGLYWLEQSIPLFDNFFNFVFERLDHFVNHFWFWRYVILQPFTKICNLLHALSNEIFFILLIFQRDIYGLEGVGCKTEVGSFEIDSSNMLRFCSTNLAASKACINSAFLLYLAFFAMAFNCTTMWLSNFIHEYFFYTFHKIKFIFVLKKVSLMKNFKFDWTKSNAKEE